MNRRSARLMTVAAVLTLVLGQLGCGDSAKKGEPKLADPNAPKFEPKTPAGAGPAGKPGAPQGAAQ